VLVCLVLRYTTGMTLLKVEGTVIFTSVTNCTLTVMPLLSFMASAQQKNELTCNSNSHTFIPISGMRLVQMSKERLAS